VELCSALELGGLTPSHGTIALVRERAPDLPVYVLIRPRAGDFVYTDAEVDTMRRDIEECGRLGCAGVVLGVLTPEGRVDVDRCRTLVDVARHHHLGVTFHRAFDLVPDQAQALEDIVSIGGVERILTSGGQRTALEGATAIRTLVERAAGRVRIMAGAGITAGNIRRVAEESGVEELHASAKRELPTGMLWTPADTLGMGGGEVRSDVDEVRAMAEALSAIP
jgi:copper homeostasis protein